MNRDNLHLTQLGALAVLQQQLRIVGSGTQVVAQAQALSPRDASMIYGEVARYGYSGFNMIPGGAQIASGDGVTTAVLTGSGWQFVQDLTRSPGWEPVVDKMGVTIEQFMSKFPGAYFHTHIIDLQAVWEHVDGDSGDQYLASRFLKREAQTIGAFEGFDYQGAGLRLCLMRPSDVPLPAGMTVIGAPASGPTDQFDVRIEPFFADRTKLWLQVVGQFRVPTTDVRLVTSRARTVHNLLWNQLADKITMEVR